MGRTDLPQYLHACELVRNAIPYLTGGAYRRPGTFHEDRYDATTDYAPRLIPFIVSKSEAYMLLFSKAVGGNGEILAYRPTSNTAVSTKSTATGAHPYDRATAGNVSTIGYYDEWRDVRYTQSADVMWLVHPRYKPYKLSRTAVDTFALAAFDNGLTGATFRDAWPYRPQNLTAITLAINTDTVGTGRTVTASAAFFNSAHVGAVFKSDDGSGTIGCFRVTAFTNSTTVTVEVMVALGTTGARLTWWESAWSDYRGWPSNVCFFLNRLAYSGWLYQPDSIAFSETADYGQMSVAAHVSSDEAGDGSTHPTGSQPFSATLLSQQLNMIEWMAPERSLLLGTTGDEILIDRAVSTAGFGADNIQAVSLTHYGSANYQAARIGSEIVFVLPSAKEIRSLVFNNFEQTYNAEPIQLLYDEYPRTDTTQYTTGSRRYRDFAWDITRNTLWCCDTAGNLFGMTRERRLDVAAWHSHRIGGYDSTKTGGRLGSTTTITVDPAYEVCAGSVLSVAVLPNPSIGIQDVWVVVKRKSGASWFYDVERMIGEHIAYDSVLNVINNGVGNYLVDGAAFTTGDFPSTEDHVFAVGTHLNGQVPIGVASNTKGLFPVTGDAVSSGNTTMQTPYPTGLATEATAVAWGYAFNPIIKPVRPEAGSQIGTSQGAIKRIHRATFRFYRTMHAKVGRDAANLESIEFRTGSQPMGESAELFTGDKSLPVHCDYDRDGYLYVTQDAPLPFALMSIIAEGDTYDG